MDPLWNSCHPLVQAVLTCPSEVENNDGWKKEMQHLIVKYENEGMRRHEDITHSLPQRTHPLVLWACAYEKPCLLKWLIEHGLDPLVQKKDTGENGLHCALSHINKSSCEQFGEIVALMPNALLQQNNFGNTPFHIACKEMSIDGCNSIYYGSCLLHMLQIARKQGQDFLTVLVNCQNMDGDTPLHLLSHHEKCLPFVKSLLSDGKADVSIRNKNHMTPLDIAITSGTMKISSILTSYHQTSGKPAKSPGHGGVHFESMDSVKKIDNSQNVEKPQRKKLKGTSMPSKICQTSHSACPVASSTELVIQKHTLRPQDQEQPPQDDLKPSSQLSFKSTSPASRSIHADNKAIELAGCQGQGLIAYLSMSDKTRSVMRDTLLRDQQDSLQQLKKIETEIADVSIELQNVQEEKDKQRKVVEKILSELEEHQVQSEKLARRSVLLRQQEADKQKQMNIIKEKIKMCETALNDLNNV